MRLVIHFLASLLLAILFGFSALVAILMTIGLIVGVVEAEGDHDRFLAKIHHYTDDFDENFVIHRHPHPLLYFFGVLAASYAATFALGWSLQWLSSRRPMINVSGRNGGSTPAIS